ncbi:MAG TPA: hypothetical protein VFI74_05490 [Candidatus Saccharimonadales bacterium]|nr:hypothetical protein [Candidatus Saccharimonadales bacterium]
MTIIAQGAQYKVIDTHDGRVKKIPLTAAESRKVIAGWYAPNPAPRKDLAIDYRAQALDSCKKIRALLISHPELRPSFGNPAFEEAGIYTQDALQTLGAALEDSSKEQAKELIRGYLDLILLHWQYGLSEKVFNCTVNNALSHSGKVVLLDFGEVTFDKEEVLKSIISKRWLHSFSYKKQIPGNLKEYYAHCLSERLTPAVLNATWGILKT